MKHSGPFVLTINAEDRRTDPFVRELEKRGLLHRMLVSRVSGFGRPELRVASHDFVRGLTEISKYINTEFKLEPAL